MTEITANPKKLIIIGMVLVVIGALLPWLMVLHYIESTFFLNFLSFGCSVAGLMLGLIGALSYAAQYLGKNRDRY